MVNPTLRSLRYRPFKLAGGVCLLGKVSPVSENPRVHPRVGDGERTSGQDVRMEHQEDLVSVTNAKPLDRMKRFKTAATCHLSPLPICPVSIKNRLFQSNDIVCEELVCTEEESLFGSPPVISFGFSCFAYVELASTLLVWSYPNPSNRKMKRFKTAAPCHLTFAYLLIFI